MDNEEEETAIRQCTEPAHDACNGIEHVVGLFSDITGHLIVSTISLYGIGVSEVDE